MTNPLNLIAQADKEFSEKWQGFVYPNFGRELENEVQDAELQEIFKDSIIGEVTFKELQEQRERNKIYNQALSDILALITLKDEMR